MFWFWIRYLEEKKTRPQKWPEKWRTFSLSDFSPRRMEGVLRHLFVGTFTGTFSRTSWHFPQSLLIQNFRQCVTVSDQSWKHATTYTTVLQNLSTSCQEPIFGGQTKIGHFLVLYSDLNSQDSTSTNPKWHMMISLISVCLSKINHGIMHSSS